MHSCSEHDALIDSAPGGLFRQLLNKRLIGFALLRRHPPERAQQARQQADGDLLFCDPHTSNPTNPFSRAYPSPDSYRSPIGGSSEPSPKPFCG